MTNFSKKEKIYWITKDHKQVANWEQKKPRVMFRSRFRCWRVWIGSQRCWMVLLNWPRSGLGSSQCGATWTHSGHPTNNNNSQLNILLATLVFRKEEHPSVKSHINWRDKITCKPSPSLPHASSNAPSPASTTPTTTKHTTTPSLCRSKRSVSQCAPLMIFPNSLSLKNKKKTRLGSRDASWKLKVFSKCCWNLSKTRVNNC